MTGISTKTFLMAAALAALSTSAFAQAAAPTPWELKPDMGYAYGKDGKTLSYKMGTNNAGTLLKGAKKVPKGTLFFSARTASSTCAPAPISRATASSCSERIEGSSFSPCGRRWREAPDEGFARAETTPHPSRDATACVHPLPQGERA